ncbi:hypothetical protein [Nostoc sp. FACHB-133]|uniref:hypothetical protein n=1 Tax=Nostoc sp. FACHB-133 TaxID=2692835 RepID=UPI001F54EAD0|nr:hypothetical protein [Nostoc sp. FACHB-133]
MGITASYKRIKTQKFAEIQNDTKAAESSFKLNLDDLVFDFSNPQALTIPELFPGWELPVTELWPPIFTEEETQI